MVCLFLTVLNDIIQPDKIIESHFKIEYMNDANNIGKDHIIDLHIAEYNALTMRCTYIMTIHVVLLAALVTWLTVMGSMIETKPSWFKWITISGAQIFAIISAMYLYGYYIIILYLETILKPTISESLKTEKNWRYQSFVSENRIKGFVVWEFSGLLIDVGIIITISLLQPQWAIADLFWFLFNIVLLFIYFHRISNAVKIRLKIKKAIQSLA